MSRTRLYIFDLDGTLYRGNEPIPFAVETVQQLVRTGAQVAYLTNNSTQTRLHFTEKLQKMGFPVQANQVHSSATGTAAWLESQNVSSSFVVGMPGLVATLEDRGIRVVNELPSLQDLNLNQKEPPVQAESVVVGLCQVFTYALLDGALQQLLGGAKFVATNTDATFPLEGGKLVPGAGSLVASVQTVSGMEPFVVGKPNPTMIEQIIREAGVSKDETVVVGDRYETDIVSGLRAGCATHMVLTGITSAAPEGQRFSPDLRGLL